MAGKEEMTMTSKEESEQVEARFAAILRDAAARYADTSGDSLTDFTKTPVHSVADLTQQLNAQNESFSKFRARRHALIGAVSAVLKPVELLGEIVSGAAGDVFSPSESIYGAVMLLVNAAHDVSAQYDAIIELFDELKVCQASIYACIFACYHENANLTKRNSRDDLMCTCKSGCHRHCVRILWKFWHVSSKL